LPQRFGDAASCLVFAQSTNARISADKQVADSAYGERVKECIVSFVGRDGLALPLRAWRWSFSWRSSLDARWRPLARAAQCAVCWRGRAVRALAVQWVGVRGKSPFSPRRLPPVGLERAVKRPPLPMRKYSPTLACRYRRVGALAVTRQVMYRPLEVKRGAKVDGTPFHHKACGSKV
jgi:hypothetical protein